MPVTPFSQNIDFSASAAFRHLKSKAASETELRALKAYEKIRKAKFFALIASLSIIAICFIGFAIFSLVSPQSISTESDITMPDGAVCAHIGIVSNSSKSISYTTDCSRDEGSAHFHMCHGSTSHTHVRSPESLGLSRAELEDVDTVTVYLNENSDALCAVVNDENGVPVIDRGKLSATYSWVVAFVSFFLLVTVWIALYLAVTHGFGKPWYQWFNEYKQKIESQEFEFRN